VALLTGLAVLLRCAAALPGRIFSATLLAIALLTLILLTAMRLSAALFTCFRRFLRIVLKIITRHYNLLFDWG
jgi:hypothetical protein